MKRATRIIGKMSDGESCRGKFRKIKILTTYAVYIDEIFVENKWVFNECKSQSNYDNKCLDYTYPKHRLSMTGAFYSYIKLLNHIKLV